MAAPGITILKNNVPWGPFTRAQIEDGLGRGDYTVKYLAHAPGLKEWLPLGEVLDYVEKSEGRHMPLLPPVPEQREFPPIPEAPRPKPEAPSISVPAPEPSAPKPAVVAEPVKPSPPTLPTVSEKREVRPEPRPEVHLEPASCFLRGLAFAIDCAILFVPIALLYTLGALAIEIPAAIHHIPHQVRIEEWDHLKDNISRLFWLVMVGFGWFYVAGLECSPLQATLGKRLMGIKITDAHGERISFLRSTCRYGAKYLSALPCFLGFIMALFSSRNLALHDRLTETRAVRE
jgi:uncharacterized RDD family membrane protein YckC